MLIILFLCLEIQITELGLPGVLFGMLDTESDPSLVSHIHDTLTSMLHMLAADSLTEWLVLCKDVLTISYGKTTFEYKPKKTICDLSSPQSQA